MSSAWAKTTVGQVCSVRTGKKDVNQGNPDGAYPFFTCAKQHTYSDVWSFDGEALLIAGNGDVGNLSYYNGKFEAYQRTYVLMDFEQVLPHFLYYVFEAGLKPMLFGQKLGNTMPYIKKGMITDFPLPLPPLEEQKRIVAVLDQAFAALDRARALAEANLADAEELFERQLAEEFANAGDQVGSIPFAQLCTALTPKTKIQRKDYLKAGAFPIVSQEADLVSGYWNERSALMGLTKPVVVFGDHTRCLKYIDFDFVVGADGTKVLLPKPGIDSLYLYYGLRSVPLAEKGYARHFKFLKDACLPKLELAEQERMSFGLRSLEAEISKLTEAYEDKLRELSDLRQSLLQKAFAGELT